MSLRTRSHQSRKPFIYGIVAIAAALLLGAPLFQVSHSAGKGQQKAKGGTLQPSTSTTLPAGTPGQTGSQATANSKTGKFINLDVRVNDAARFGAMVSLHKSAITRSLQTQKASLSKGISNLKASFPNSDVKLSQITGGVEVVRNTTGALSGLAPGMKGADIVRSFIQSNSSLYGLSKNDIANLNFIGESFSQGSGLRMVRVEQTVNGIPVFQSETRFILDKEGRIFRSTGLLIPGAADNAAQLDAGNLLSAQDALAAAMKRVDIDVDSSLATLSSDPSQAGVTKIAANNEHISGEVVSKLVYFPTAPGILTPAWSQVAFTDGSGDWYTITDATTGETLWRKNIRDNASLHDARFRVYVQADGTTPADSPAPLSPTNVTVGSGTQPTEIAPTIVSMHTAMSATASQNGWIDDCPGGVCTAAQTQTIGNNVHAYMDRVGGADNNIPDTAASSVIDGAGKPMGNPDANARNRDFLGTTPRDFQTGYLPPPQAGNPEAGQTATGNGNNGTLAVDQFRRGMLTQLFYVANWYHDQLFALGFDEAAGNFQQTNFSGMGLGNDRVLAEGEDNSGTNNSNFSTPPDGQSGRAQMFRFTGPTIDRDGSLDAEVLMHELTHGTSNRLIGNGSGLIWDPGAGMGEGWSDFYALSLLNNTSADDPNGNYAFGAYATYKIIPGYTDNYLYGIRRFPYSTNNSVNPLTWGDVDDVTNNLSGGIAPDPLGANIGGGAEVHNTGELWALTLWEVRSRIIAANAGSVPTGNHIMLQIVTDALKMTPITPSFTDARDALIDADCAANACANEQSIWDGFADRGLGYNALASTAYGFNFIASHEGIRESFSSPFLDNNGVTIDDSLGNNNGSVDPGEPVKITVSLKNPWRNSSKNVASATATLSTSTAGVTITDSSSTYGAIPAQGNATGDTFAFTVPIGATCGQSLNFTITPTSSLGSHPVDFSLRVGAPAGTGAPITYTKATSLAIPDNQARGVTDTQTITDDFQIADLNFRIDSLTHTFVGDLTAELKAPNGYGQDYVALIGAGIGQGAGQNLTNMVIDDSATGDMLIAPDTNAPYTASWLPVFNDPSWTSVGFGGPDPVGELGKLNGVSTKGTWTVLAGDEAAGDVGTLHSWSMIVTPRAFACQTVFGPVPTAGQLKISEFRVRGPSGANDEFVEVYNATGAQHTVSPSSGTGYAVVASDGVARCIIPNGTVIPAGGHYLCANSIAYSLSGYAAADTSYTTDIPDNAGIALFNSSTTFTLANRLDAVGSTAEANTLYKEGTGYGALTPFSIDYAFYRDLISGSPKDTDNNAADFLFVDTNGTSAGAGQRLGAPGPQNLGSPRSTSQVQSFVVDPGQGQNFPPNRVRDFTSVPANNSTFGTLDIRREFINNTGAAITRLRFRVVDITTFPSPTGTADLRPITSSSVVVSLTGGGNTTVQGTTLEQPPSQPNGGGFNTTMSAGTVTLGTPLNNGAAINVRFVMGVQQIGNFRFFIEVEALP